MVMEQLRKLRARMFGANGGEQAAHSSDVVEIEVKNQEERKISLQLGVLEKFGDTENILAAMRSGSRIMLVKIRALREKDMTELKRSINRLKTHCAATGGDMAAIDDNWVIVVPPTVEIERT